MKRKTLVAQICLVCSLASAFAPISTLSTRRSIDLGPVSTLGYSFFQDSEPLSFSSSSFQTAGTTIDWNNPSEFLVGGFFLVYVLFSVFAGLKYVIKDGWRPKL